MSEIPQSPIKFVLYASRFHKRWAFAAIFTVIVANFLGRYTVIILRNLTDALANYQNGFSDIWHWVLFYSIFDLVNENIWRLSGFAGMRWIVNLKVTAYRDLYQYITHHSKDYFNNRFAGSLENKISNAADGSDHLVGRLLWNFFPTCMGALIYVGIAWQSDYRLGLIILVWTTFYFLLNIVFAKKIQVRARKQAASNSNLRGVVIDSISNISLVHENAYLRNEHEHIFSFLSKRKKADLSEWWLSEWFLVANGFLILIFTASMLVTTVYLLQLKLITVGVVIMVIAIIRDISHQLFFLGQELKEAGRTYGQINEGLQEVLQDHDVATDPEAYDGIIENSEIVFDSVNFSYERSPIYRNFSLHIPAGQKVGLIGHSGAGKTTFVSLLLRHFDVSDGTISIGGRPINQLTLESLRRSIAVVPQDSSLFHRSIRENIASSNPNATQQQVEQAAKLALAHGFISKLPKQYDTIIGERGIKLSGGQRQRLAIARAFLKDSPILVLDEATSSLDSESEQAIQISLRSLMKGRTVIAIAHRLSTLKEMDRIVIMRHGKVIEDGPVEDLLKNPHSEFKRMWEHQVKGFIVE